MSGLKNNLFQALKDLIHIWWLETKVILHDEGVLIFCLFVPLGYPLLYSYIYHTEVMREIPITIVDQSHTALSREFIRKMDASQWTRVVGLSRDVPDARQQVREGRTYGFLVIPSDFSRNIVRGKQSYVGMYSAMSAMLYYKGILIAATDVSLEMNKEIKIAEAGKITVEEEKLTTYPVQSQEVTLFNPAQGFASFLIPPVLMLIIQQTLLLGVGMAGGTAVERREYSELIATSRRNNGTIHILFGRAAAYFLIYAMTSAYSVCIVPRIFSFTQLSRPLDLALFMIPYLLACIFFALSMSIMMRNREMSILAFVVTSVPLLFISGVSWPGSAVPPFLKGISCLFPSTFGINGFVRLNTMGATLDQVRFEWKALWIQSAVYCVTAYISCRVIIYYEKRNLVRHHAPLAAK
jgi:ABC-2 type transport system permease protein